MCTAGLPRPLGCFLFESGMSRLADCSLGLWADLWKDRWSQQTFLKAAALRLPRHPWRWKGTFSQRFLIIDMQQSKYEQLASSKLIPTVHLLTNSFWSEHSIEWISFSHHLTSMIKANGLNQALFLTIKDFQLIFNWIANCAQPCIWLIKEYPIPLNLNKVVGPCPTQNTAIIHKKMSRKITLITKEDEGVICQCLLPCPII